MFHEKELYLQHKLESNINYDKAQKLITNKIDEKTFRFIQSLNFSFLSVLDENNFPQVVPLIGSKLFELKSSSIITLKLKQLDAFLEVFDIVISSSKYIGLLFIDFITRRRFRINGFVNRTNNKLEITIQQAFTNCPKYIQSRSLELQFLKKQYLKKQFVLNQRSKEIIGNADTFFLATSHKNGTLDMSHRGGKKGFVTITSENCLKIPDYKGNGLYNSLGNILGNAKVGMLFIDFDNNVLLHLKGEAKIFFHEERHKIQYWDFIISECLCYDQTFKIESQFFDSSIYNQ